VARKYIYEYSQWPDFTWDVAALSPLLCEARLLQGRVLGRLDALGFTIRNQTAASALTEEIIKSSEIEGKYLDESAVRSSVAKRLGVGDIGNIRAGRDVEGFVDMMIDATENNKAPLTDDRLFGWHTALFPAGRSGISKIITGAYRENKMQIVSGAYGKEKIHYEAPPPDRVPCEMNLLLSWINGEQGIDPVLKAGIAHFWFIIIHPFDDGNGRLARAITELLLARSDGSKDRYYSFSQKIAEERKAYTDILHKEQFSKGDITGWLSWFTSRLIGALEESNTALDKALAKTEFWDKHKDVPLNARQQKMLNQLLDGFTGKLTTKKWSALTKTSHDTALRDIKDLIGKGLLVQEEGGGKNTGYRLA
jgi:Fic family protein